MSKHILFLIHGIGSHESDWSEELDGPIETLKKVSQQYQYFKQAGQDPFGQRVECVSVHYDEVFRDMIDDSHPISSLNTPVGSNGVIELASFCTNFIGGKMRIIPMRVYTVPALQPWPPSVTTCGPASGSWRYGRYLNVGAIWHDQNNDGRMFNQSPFFVIGIDLFRFAEYKYPAYKKQYEQWTNKAQKLIGASK